MTGERETNETRDSFKVARLNLPGSNVRTVDTWNGLPMCSHLTVEDAQDCATFRCRQIRERGITMYQTECRDQAHDAIFRGSL